MRNEQNNEKGKGDKAMMYIVEIPHQSAPVAWKCKDNADFIQVALIRHGGGQNQTYEETTGRQILENHGCFSLLEFRMDCPELEGLANLIEQQGLDTIYYRGFTQDEYTATPIDAFLDCVELAGHDLHFFCVYFGDAAVIKALADNEDWEGHQGFEAREALRAIL